MAKPNRNQIKIVTWQERDRLHVGIHDKRTGKSVVDWWDNDVQQLFEDGFFKGGMPREHWHGSEAPSPEFVNSIVEYAEDMGFLAKMEKPAPGIVVGEFTIKMDRQGNILIDFSYEPDKDVFLQFQSDKESLLDLLTLREQNEINRGWEIKIRTNEPRASILQEIWSTAATAKKV